MVKQSDLAFNLVLKLAIVVCLVTLVLGLVVGVGPLTVLLRSSAAFTTFAILAWAISLVWQVPEPEPPGPSAETGPVDETAPVDKTSPPPSTLSREPGPDGPAQ